MKGLEKVGDRVGYQGILESADPLDDEFSLITLRAKRGKERVKLRVKTVEVDHKMIGKFVSLTLTVQEVPTK